MASPTLMEMAKTTQDPFSSAIVQLYASGSNLLPYMQVETEPGFTYTYNEASSLASSTWRGFGGSWTPSAATLNTVTEPKAILGGELDWDTVAMQAQGPAGRAPHIATKLSSIAKNFDKAVIKGDSETTAGELDGLQVRLTSSTQKIANGATANGTPLSLAKVAAAKDAVLNPTHWICGRGLKRRIDAAAHSTSVGGYIQFMPNQLGTPVYYLAGLPIITLDVDGTFSELMDFDEAASSGTSTATSLFCVNLSGPDGVKVIQSANPVVTDMGQIGSAIVFRIRFEWHVALKVPTRAACRLWTISDAAVTA